MTPDEIIAVVQAHKNGKPIELRLLNSIRPWKPCKNPHWNFDEFEYRVTPPPAPKLAPHWQCVYICGDLPFLSTALFQNVEQAKKYIIGTIRLATEYPPIMLEEQ